MDRAVLYFHGGGYRAARAGVQRVRLPGRVALGAPLLCSTTGWHQSTRSPPPSRTARRRTNGLLDQGTPAPERLPRRHSGRRLAVSTLLAVRTAGMPQPAAAVCLSRCGISRPRAESYDRCAHTDPIYSRAQALAAAGLPQRHRPARPTGLTGVRRLGDLAPLLVHASDREGARSTTRSHGSAGHRGGRQGDPWNCGRTCSTSGNLFVPDIPEATAGRARRRRLLYTHLS